MQQKNVKLFIYPLISLGIFIVLVFGAAYAYIAGTITMNTSNYQVTLPQQTSLVCTKTDCGVTITPSQMARANNSTTAKSSNMCSVNCTCSGAQGAVCAYNVFVVEAGTSYVPSSSLGTNKEFTVTVTSPTGCTTQNSSGTETQVNTLNSKIVSNCTLTVPQSGSVSANVTAEFKWYNLDMPQDGHASKTYKYQLSTGNDIPDAYQLVEYIRTTGTQYINTGYVPDNNTSIEMEVISTSTSNAALYCARVTNLSRTYTAFIITGSSIRWDYYTSQTTVSSFTKGQRYVIKQDKNNFYINGSLIHTMNEETFNSGYNMYLLASHESEGHIVNIGNGVNLYYAKIWDNGTLVRDFVPVSRKSDDKVGLYDYVTKQFYPDASGGNFAKGSDI